MLNASVITVCGNLTFDPVPKSLPDGTGITEIRIASTVRRRNSAGDWEDGTTTYYRVTCWRRLGERVARSLHKGDAVVVVGRFQGGEWTDRDGARHQTYEIDADVVGPDLNRVEATVHRAGRAAQPVEESAVTPTPPADRWASEYARSDNEPVSEPASEPAA